MDNELLLYDRLNVIKDTINKYGADNFYIGFSGGKDSTVVHHLVDMALPGNTIPRAFVNTGIEYIEIVKFVREMASKDPRIEIVNAGVNIKQMLEKYGYPFKSKEHATKLGQYQTGLKRGYQAPSTLAYITGKDTAKFKCPNILAYQFDPSFNLKVSAQCCVKMKKNTTHRYERERERTILITGMQRSEGGQREHIDCTVFREGKMVKFHPLAKVDDDWEQWFIDKYNIQLCKLYYEPYNFERTGCKGCPFALNLQDQLETMEKYLPNERKQCEIIWKPVYDEYRRIGYRLKKDEQLKLF